MSDGVEGNEERRRTGDAAVPEPQGVPEPRPGGPEAAAEPEPAPATLVKAGTADRTEAGAGAKADEPPTGHADAAAPDASGTPADAPPDSPNAPDAPETPDAPDAESDGIRYERLPDAPPPILDGVRAKP
ncbi:DUF4173 domain-containing protein, partial [Streptomyces albidoflavus]